MHIEHVAIWTDDLERMKVFYVRYFEARAGERYRNPDTHFESYFLSFTSGARLELMTAPDVEGRQAHTAGNRNGYTHLAFSCGDPSLVDELTQRIREDGYRVVQDPRRTGDGYYESVVLDPDGNRVEITV